MVDFNIDNGHPIKTDDVDLILQQIDILFDTNPRELLGYDEFGTQYDTYLYKLNLSNVDIQQRVLSDIKSLNLFDFEPHVEVHLLQGTEQDIALIEITLTRDEETYQRIYKIS